MAKKFDIHEWKSKQRLAEANNFTPDLKDDELKRGAIQQMMAKEKPKTPQDAPRGTLNNTITDLAEMYSYGEILDALKVFYTDNGEQPFADMAKKHAKEFRDFLDNEDEGFPFGDPLAGFPEIEENMTGTGASIQAGEGMGHFGKKKKRKNTSSGDMAYTQSVNENEEENKVDDEENPIEPESTSEPIEPDIPDTPSELSKKLKSLSSEIKKPMGAKGMDKAEIENLSIILDKILEAMRDGNATQILTKMVNIIPD